MCVKMERRVFLQRRVQLRRHHLHLPPHFTLHIHKQDVPPRALRRGSSAEGARKAVVAVSRHSTAAALSNTDARSVIMMASKAEASSFSVSVVRGERKEKRSQNAASHGL